MPHRAESAAAERQISVDPISVRESEDDFMHTNAYDGPKLEVISLPLNNFLGKFMSCSLPNSPKKKCKDHEEGRPMARQHSVALSNLERLRQSHLQRSKSCGEGRLCQPSLDFDLCSITTTTTNKNKMDDYGKNKGEAEEEQGAASTEEEEMVFHKKGGETYEEKFKCGACMFLPGFGKGKAVKARKEPEPEPEPERGLTHVVDMVSHRASLEKFECGSWRSSTIMNYDECHQQDDGGGDTDASNLFFDLPVELIRCSSVNDTESPVTTGFTFDNKDSHHNRKGVLKNARTTGGNGNSKYNTGGNVQAPRKSNESCNSSRHVRFSTSSPATPASPTSACITPRFLKASDDFTAFLEAQSA